MLTDKNANDTAADFIKRKIRSIVKDSATAAILSDIDHPYAAKRPPIDTNYFETYNRPNVALVDLRKAPIERVSRTGICTTKAEYPVDIIVFATGFDAMTGPLLRIDIRGRSGVALKDVWVAGPRNYLGLQVSGFPNLFTITGPGSPSVLCNMPVAIEQHADWITDCIRHLSDSGLDRIEARPEAMDKWVAEVNEVASKTVFPMAKHSWYLGANIPGKPRVFMPYAGGMVRYRQICAEVAENAFYVVMAALGREGQRGDAIQRRTAIDLFRRASRASWMAGSSPTMTIKANSASPRLRVKPFMVHAASVFLASNTAAVLERRFSASRTSSSAMMSGGSRRTTLSPAPTASILCLKSSARNSVLGTRIFSPSIRPCPRTSSNTLGCSATSRASCWRV